MIWLYLLGIWVVCIVFFVGYMLGNEEGYRQGFKRGLYQSVSDNLHRSVDTLHHGDVNHCNVCASYHLRGQIHDSRD